MNIKKIISCLLILALLLSSTFSLAETITIDLSKATDEELAEAAAKIKDEQKARLKTTILLEPAELTVNKGQSQKVAATVMDLPEGVKASQFTWTSSDEAVATCAYGTIRGTGAGTATITCTTVLSDETEVSANVAVTCVVPVQGVAPAARTIEIMAGDTATPEIVIKPEDATNKELKLESSDESIVKVTADGQLEAKIPGNAVITITSTDGTNKAAKMNVTVTKRIGKYDDELTFQGIPWGTEANAAYDLLAEKGLVEKQETSWNRASFTSWYRYWPENDLFFANYNAWQELPVAFSDQQKGTAQMNLRLLKKIGGYTPQTASMFFLNPIDADNQINTEKTELCGVYLHFDNDHEPGSEIFANLLTKMESQYGEFTRYVNRDFTGRYYKEIYDGVKGVMEGAKTFTYRDFQKEKGKDFWLNTCAICTLTGKNDTGIMLMIDTSGYVTLFYGKKDVLDRLHALQEILEAVPDDKEDAGI